MPSSTFNLKSQHSLWNCKVERTNAQSLCIFNELLVQPVAFLHNLCSSRMIVASESNARNLIILMCWKKKVDERLTEFEENKVLSDEKLLFLMEVNLRAVWQCWNNILTPNYLLLCRRLCVTT